MIGDDGESEDNEMNCWQQILHAQELSPEEIKKYTCTGLPMPILMQYSEHSIIPQPDGRSSNLLKMNPN